jgi:hypothetical protein
MGRLRVWLFHLLSRIAVAPPDDPLPRPTPGEIMAVRVLIPTESNRTPGEQICIAMFRLGYRKRLSEERPTFKPVAPAPQPGGTTAVFVDKTGQQQAQHEMTQSDPLKSPWYISQIHTQHSMPAMPAVSPLRKSRLTQILHAAVPVPPPVIHKTRTLTPLPDPIEFFEEDDDASWLNSATEKRKAV